MSNTQQKLDRFQALIEAGLTGQNMIEAMALIGAEGLTEGDFAEWKLYSEYLPRVEDAPFTEASRNMMILWESLDRVPLGINCAFSIPARALLAKVMFKGCGKGLVAYEHVHFNYPQLLEVGDNVAFNCGCLIDSKGGVKIGNHTFLAENVTIFSHAHHEEDHMTRDYTPVTIGDHVILGAGCTIMGGVTIADGAFVGVGSVVTHDVEENTVVAGSPARPIRPAKRAGKLLKDCNHYFFKDRLFQDK